MGSSSPTLGRSNLAGYPSLTAMALQEFKATNSYQHRHVLAGLNKKATNSVIADYNLLCAFSLVEDTFFDAFFSDTCIEQASSGRPCCCSVRAIQKQCKSVTRANILVPCASTVI